MFRKSIIGLLIICLALGIYFWLTRPTIPLTITNQNDAPVLLVEETEQDSNQETEEVLDEDKEDTTISEIITRGIQQTIASFQNREVSIVAMGDSLTQGVGDETENGGFIGVLEYQLNHGNQIVTFENYGRRGDRTNHLITRFKDPEVIKSIENADMILITIGANDIMQVAKENFTNLTYEVFASERKEYEERLQTILEKAVETNPNAPIYIIGFYNPFQEYFPEVEELDQIVDDWNHTAKTSVEQYENGTFIPTKDLFVNSEKHLFAEDHFHPNYEGYLLMAERILEYITD